MASFDIVPLPREQYEGYRFPFDYESELYYDVRLRDTNDGFAVDFVRMPFPNGFAKRESDTLFSQGGDAPAAYGILEAEKPIALLEITPEYWNNRLRVINLWVDAAHRRQGLGRALMDYAKQTARLRSFRAIVLETQSSNSKAIAFYLSQGFTLAGFDAFAYSNDDIEKKEVRLEMVYRPPRTEA